MSDTTSEVAKIGQAFRHCADIVRLQDKDRFLSSLFAPAEQRLFLFALYAFDVETARVRDLVDDPMAGNIRLQWWHEAMAGLRPGEAEAHPVLAALTYTLEAAAGGDRTLVTQAVEARQAELYGEPAVGAASAIFKLASRFLAPTKNMPDSMIEDAGRAEVFSRNPADPQKASEAYEAFRAGLKMLPVTARPAFLHLALVPLRLRLPDASQWRRQLGMMRAAWFGYPKI
jgi:phytoene synthase